MPRNHRKVLSCNPSGTGYQPEQAVCSAPPDVGSSVQGPEQELYLHPQSKRSVPEAEPTLVDLLQSQLTSVLMNQSQVVIPIKMDVDTTDVDKALDKTKQLLALEEAAGNINNSIIDVTDMSDKDRGMLALQGYELKDGRVLAVKRTGGAA